MLYRYSSSSDILFPSKSYLHLLKNIISLKKVFFLLKFFKFFKKDKDFIVFSKSLNRLLDKDNTRALHILLTKKNSKIYLLNF